MIIIIIFQISLIMFRYFISFILEHNKQWQLNPIWFKLKQHFVSTSMKIVKLHRIVPYLIDYDYSSKLRLYVRSWRQSGSIIRHRIIFRTFTDVTMNSCAAHKRTNSHWECIRSWRTSMDATRRAKIHFVGPRIVPAASFVPENSIRKQTTRENKWLSQFGSRLINRSQFPSSVYSILVLSFFFFLRANTLAYGGCADVF